MSKYLDERRMNNILVGGFAGLFIGIIAFVACPAIVAIPAMLACMMVCATVCIVFDLGN